MADIGFWMTESRHVFQSGASDWGFRHFVKVKQLNDSKQGWLKNDTLIVHANIEKATVVSGSNQQQQPSSLFYFEDSRKSTGFVGLRNQGATWYASSLPQPPTPHITCNYHLWFAN
jgi:ubiquitin carboxyl-terminal hydrolase 7